MTDEQRIYKLRTALAKSVGAHEAASEIIARDGWHKTAAKFAEIAENLYKVLEETKPE